MQAAELHQRLDELVTDMLLRGGIESADPDHRALSEHASSGCSLCARALVNSGAALAELAALPSPAAPNDRLRERVVSSARSHGLAPRPVDVRAGDSSKDRRVRDPSAIVAHMHLTGPDEAERAQEVLALGAHVRRERDPNARVLAQLERITGCPLLFVSIIRGERVGYRVQRGLPDDLQASVEMRREMTFCTHCVDAGRPLVIENAAREPFFRGNPAVQRHRARAYVGVPLRTSRGILIGTLCALDFRPRPIAREIVRALELFASRVVAEIERPRSTAGLDALLARENGDVYRRPWFEDLLGVEIARVGSERRAAALIAAPSSVIGLAAEEEVLGDIDEDTVGILLSGADPARAEARRSALEKSFVDRSSRRVGLAMAEAGISAADWLARAVSLTR